jgi:cephalosporin hydroxylase
MATISRVRSAFLRLGSVQLPVRTSGTANEFNDSSDYPKVVHVIGETTKNMLSSPDRFQSITNRKDTSVLSEDTMKNSLRGRYIRTHRGYTLLKDCLDLSIVQRLFWEVKPATIIEMGTFSGANALWMADMLKMMEIDSSIYTVDIDSLCVEEGVRKLWPPSVHFVLGDAYKLEESFSDSFMKSVKHPLVVIEDCHHNVEGILQYFDRYMQEGDYFIVEDTHPGVHAKAEMGFHEEYRPWPFGPEKRKILKEFLADSNNRYCVDTFFTDMFGYNATWNWHGYIRRM